MVGGGFSGGGGCASGPWRSPPPPPPLVCTWAAGPRHTQFHWGLGMHRAVGGDWQYGPPRQRGGVWVLPPPLKRRPGRMCAEGHMGMAPPSSPVPCPTGERDVQTRGGGGGGSWTGMAAHPPPAPLVMKAPCLSSRGTPPPCLR